jgi:hypothetical protein
MNTGSRDERQFLADINRIAQASTGIARALKRIADMMEEDREPTSLEPESPPGVESS